MHFFFRTLLARFRSRTRSRVDLWDVVRTPFRVLPTDLDVFRHMNNGVYFSILDIARLDVMMRSGLWTQFTRRGWYPVVVAETMSFRRSLELWQRFDVETRTLGFDDQAVYMEQRFVVGGEISARGYIRARFLKRSGGIVPVDELRMLAGVEPGHAAPGEAVSTRMPEWLLQWGVDGRLPSTKTAAPSAWEGWGD